MKVTKQTLYKKEWAYRPLTMDTLVALVRNGSTKQTIESFRMKWHTSLPENGTSWHKKSLVFCSAVRSGRTG